MTYAFAGKGAPPASLDRLIERMERDEFDMIAVGRAFLSDPDWVAKVRQGDFGALNGFDAGSLAELI